MIDYNFMPLKTPPINPDNSQKKKELENIKEGLESLKVYSELKNDFDQNVDISSNNKITRSSFNCC